MRRFGRDRKSTRLNSSHGYISYAVFFFNDTATTEIYPLSLHDALPICLDAGPERPIGGGDDPAGDAEQCGGSGDDRRQRLTRLERPGPGEAQRQIGVPESKCRVLAGGRESVHRRKGVAGDAPPLGTLTVGKGIEHGVDIGGDVDAVDPIVVPDIHDDGQLVGAEHRVEAACRPGTSDTSREECDPRHPEPSVEWRFACPSIPRGPLLPPRPAWSQS